MKLDHRDRPTAATLLEHGWFAELDGETQDVGK
jgi:hypothetical protein